MGHCRDVTLASASQAVIVGFNVIPDEPARALADARNVEVRRYDIIYNLALDIKALIEGRLKPEEKVVELEEPWSSRSSRYRELEDRRLLCGPRIDRTWLSHSSQSEKAGELATMLWDTLKRHKDDAKEVPRGWNAVSFGRIQ